MQGLVEMLSGGTMWTVLASVAYASNSMTAVLAEGSFFERYKRHFRFSEQEMEKHRSGMYFDKLPAALRPFTKTVFTSAGRRTMNLLRVPQTLGEENRRLVAGSPLIVGVMLDRRERYAHPLADFYCQFSLGFGARSKQRSAGCS